eukprot:scaffold173695_cov35-Attheya_sp.AAC.2
MQTQQNSLVDVPRFFKFPISSEIDPFNALIPAKERVTESNNRRLGFKQLANDDAESTRLYTIMATYSNVSN